MDCEKRKKDPARKRIVTEEHIKQLQQEGKEGIEIATRFQKNMSFGLTVFAGLVEGIIGDLSLIQERNRLRGAIMTIHEFGKGNTEIILPLLEKLM